MTRTYCLLSLGDSYTIAESELLAHSFPYQAVQQLRKKGHRFAAPEIIARTGWTTHNLMAALNDYVFLDQYDFITILTGVNNQFQGRTVEEYAFELEAILKQAIQLVQKADRVHMLSIPDYSCTPFADALDREKISKEIDLFNSANRALALQYKLQYIDVTVQSRESTGDASLTSSDGLHPSAKAYEKWADKIALSINSQLK